MSDYQYPKLEDDGTMILREGYNLTPAGAPANPDDADARKGIKTFYQTQRVEIKRLKHPPETKINGPGDVYKVLQNIGDLDREHVFLLHLNRNGEITGIEEIAVGTAAYAPIHPRELVKGAVIDSANAVIFVHNHPSGSLEFSSMDTEVARSSQIAFQIYGIPLLDFMIITRDGFTSMKERGLLPFDRSEMMLSFDTLIRGIAEGTDPDKEPTDNDIKCDLAVMIAKETLVENCRRPRNPLPGVAEDKQLDELKLKEELLARIRRQEETSASPRLAVIRDFVFKEASHESIDKCYRKARASGYAYYMQDAAFLNCMEKEMQRTKSKTQSSPQPPGVLERLDLDLYGLNASPEEREALLAAQKRCKEISDQSLKGSDRVLAYAKCMEKEKEKFRNLQHWHYYGAGDDYGKEMQKVRSKTLSPSENPEFTPVRIPQYEHSGPS